MTSMVRLHGTSDALNSIDARMLGCSIGLHTTLFAVSGIQMTDAVFIENFSKQSPCDSHWCTLKKLFNGVTQMSNFKSLRLSLCKYQFLQKHLIQMLLLIEKNSIDFSLKFSKQKSFLEKSKTTRNN